MKQKENFYGVLRARLQKKAVVEIRESQKH